ncbi:hypothetical protein B0H10DRAFT_1951340 [Mycena sp. CBHHK59/15]|nr:hypothetical protein B0H10DRAFT_1951340 [Mycena sp. CBHHK59/15]
MSTRTSVLGNDFLLELQAMAQEPSSPLPMPPSRKRARHDSSPGAGSDEEAVSLRHLLLHFPLAVEQQTQVDTFLSDVQTVGDAKIFISILCLQNDLQKIVAAAPPYSVSAELKASFHPPDPLYNEYSKLRYGCTPVPKVGMYKGNMPVQHVLDILKKHRFDMPPGFENNPADLNKVIGAIQDAFTQARSHLKKLLFASVRVMWDRVTINLPATDHQNLFALAQAFVEGTNYRISNPLCGRIALMRKIFLVKSNTSFWDELDSALAVMQVASKGSDTAIALMFDGLIKVDKVLHGAVDIIYQPTDDLQQEVDDLIDATRMNTATISNCSGDQEDEDEEIEPQVSSSSSAE